MSQQKLKTIPIVPTNNVPQFNFPMFLRRPHRPEILVFLLGDCNLRCKFCQDHDRYGDKISVQGIQQRFELFKQAIQYVEQDRIDVVVFGGEVFQDKISDDIFQHYDWWFKNVSQYLSNIGKKYQFYTTTNLIYHKIDRMIELCKKWNIFVRGSFDLWGRFKSDRIRDLFIDNLYKVKQSGLPTLVNFVAYRPNIELIYNQGHNFQQWKHLYDNFNMCLGEYTDVGVMDYQVSEKRLGQFFIWLYQHYPKISNVQNIVQGLVKGGHQIYCAYNIVIDKQISWACCDRNQAIRTFQNNKGCLTCQYYDVCYGTCPRIFKDSTDCHVRMLLDYAKQHPENILCLKNE